MPKVCSYGFCRNRGNSKIRFFQFPTSKDLERRQLWIKRCNRKTIDGKDWEPDHSQIYIYVCGAHFVTGEPWNNKTHPDYAPSIDVPPCEGSLRTSRVMRRYQRSPKRRVAGVAASSTGKLMKTEDHTYCFEIPPITKRVFSNDAVPVDLSLSCHDPSQTAEEIKTEITNITGGPPIAAQGFSNDAAPVGLSPPFHKPSQTVEKMKTDDHTNITGSPPSTTPAFSSNAVLVHRFPSSHGPLKTVKEMKTDITGGPQSTTQVSSNDAVPVALYLSFRKPSQTVEKTKTDDHTYFTGGPPSTTQAFSNDAVPVSLYLSIHKPSQTVEGLKTNDHAYLTGGPPITTQASSNDVVPVHNFPPFPEPSQAIPSFQELKAAAKEIDCGCLTLMSCNDNIVFASLTDNFSPVVELSVVVDRDFKAHLNVHGHEVPETHTVFNELPPKFDSYSKLQTLMKTVSNLFICSAVSDEGLLNFSHINEDNVLEFSKDSHTKALRSVNCQLLVEKKKRCSSCVSLRRRLLMRRLRAKKTPQLCTNLFSSRRNNTTLTSPLALAKLKSLSLRKRYLAQQVGSLKKRLEFYKRECNFLRNSQVLYIAYP